MAVSAPGGSAGRKLPQQQRKRSREQAVSADAAVQQWLQGLSLDGCCEVFAQVCFNESM